MIKVKSVAKLKKAIKAEKNPCIIMVDTYDSTIAGKYPPGHDLSKYDRFRYMFYFIGGEKVEADRQRLINA